jgi:hypothetical protein
MTRWNIVPHALEGAPDRDRGEPLPPRAPTFAFRRPAWHAIPLAISPVWFLVPFFMAPLVRVWLDRDAIVIARAGARTGRRIARADLVELRRSAGDLVIVARGGAAESLSPTGKATRKAVARGRALAAALAVPFVDELGERAPLPVARLVRT